MQQYPFIIAVLVLVAQARAQEIDKLIDTPDPAVQSQIQKVYDVLQKPGIDPRSDIDVCGELHSLKASAGKEDLVKQVAIFAATTKSSEDTHVLVAQGMLQLLDLPPRTIISVLAPYLDAENRQLRDIARMWFDAHDIAGTVPPGAPPIKPVNYEDYLEYVEWNVTRKHDIPPAFTKYIYDRAPGRALLVHAYANSHGDVTARLQAIRASIEGTEPESKEKQEQIEKGRELQTKDSRESRLKERREIELAEHIVSNALWLNKNGFADRFHQAMPDAVDQLKKLAASDKWWARLYVAYIMRQHPELHQPNLIERLSKDSTQLVREAAIGIK
jgi:hypothetical protein